MGRNKIKKKDQTGIEPVTLGPAIPRSTSELLILFNILEIHWEYNHNQGFKANILRFYVLILLNMILDNKILRLSM